MLIQGKLGSSGKLLFKYLQLWNFGSCKLSLTVHCSNSNISVFTAVEVFRENSEEGLQGLLLTPRSKSKTISCTLGTGSESVRQVQSFRVM
jgi:hypothetical protein